MTPEAEAEEILKPVIIDADKEACVFDGQRYREGIKGRIINALRKYQSRIEELEGKLFGQTEELLYLREHVTGGNDGLYLPPKQYNNLSETTKALESFYRKEFDKIKAALESTNSKLREALEGIMEMTPGYEYNSGYHSIHLMAKQALASKESESGKP